MKRFIPSAVFFSVVAGSSMECSSGDEECMDAGDDSALLSLRASVRRHQQMSMRIGEWEPCDMGNVGDVCCDPTVVCFCPDTDIRCQNNTQGSGPSLCPAQDEAAPVPDPELLETTAAPTEEPTDAPGPVARECGDGDRCCNPKTGNLCPQNGGDVACPDCGTESCACPAQDAPRCFDGGVEEFELTLPAFDNKKVIIPKLPQHTEAYAYATENALVAIPKACYHQFKHKIRDNTTITDPGGAHAPYFYLKDLDGGLDTLASMNRCACGLVIEVHGSGGPDWAAVQLASLFSGTAGFIQVIPNSMAMPDELGLKGKLPEKPIQEIDVSNWCGAYDAFNGSCSDFSKPYCYSTKVENILAQPERYRMYVEGVYQIRKRELDYFVDHNQKLLKAFEKVFLVGNSEGAMVAARYYHPKLESILAGRIISSWSCDFNYYVSCPAHAQVCEDKCSKTVPQLNLIGSQDGFFGATDSVAWAVAGASHGYGGPLTGNCRAAYAAQGFEKATVAVLVGSGHEAEYTNDNTWWGIIADFINHAGVQQDEWESLKACSLADGVYRCEPPSVDACTSNWTVNPNSTWQPAAVLTGNCGASYEAAVSK